METKKYYNNVEIECFMKRPYNVIKYESKEA